MRLRKEAIIIVVAVFLALAASPAQSASATMGCTADAVMALNLTDVTFGQPLTSVTATVRAATSSQPENCYVTGFMWPQIGFEVALPTTAWNGKFYMAGGGGFNGSLPSLTAGLGLNYATAGTDSGHNNALYPTIDAPNARFAYNDPVLNNNPNAAQKKVDFAYRSYYETAILAKKIVKAYYGSDPAHSYWVGCSEGGREALMMAQRFPMLFDGIVGGSPIAYLTRAHMWSVWNPRALLDGPITTNQLPFLASQVYAKCDGYDGLVDGLIDDPRTCDFDPTTLPTCGTASDTCFTTAQITALQKIWGGVVTSFGLQLFPGLPKGVEVCTNPTSGTTSGWSGWLIGNPSLQQSIGESSMQYFSMTPQPGPTWHFTDFNFDTDYLKLAATSVIADNINPDLTVFKQHNGKLIHYAGWADPALTPYMTSNYYDSVLKTMGGEAATTEFYKLYMIPGMFHCSGGVGCGTADFFGALVNWVENGVEPQAITGSRNATAYLTARTRPLCPYPEVARWNGSGSIDSAASFMCVPPITMKVDSGTINFRGNVMLVSTTITIPEGFTITDWNIGNVKLDGAPSLRVSCQGSTCQAVFNRASLPSTIPAGDAVPLTIQGTFMHGGVTAQIQAIGYAKVIR